MFIMKIFLVNCYFCAIILYILYLYYIITIYLPGAIPTKPWKYINPLILTLLVDRILPLIQFSSSYSSIYKHLTPTAHARMDAFIIDSYSSILRWPPQHMSAVPQPSHHESAPIKYVLNIIWYIVYFILLLT